MLNRLKTLLGTSVDNHDDDNRLQLILDMASERLGTILGIQPPASLDHIVIEVAIMRFNRIGSEGLSAHSVEGESLTFLDSDFAPFMDEIRAYQQTQEESKTGRVRFL